MEVLEPGPGRVQPRCAHFGVCGGCAWQDLDYAEQLRHKRAQVVDALERLGGFTGVTVDAIEPAVEIYGYRNKVEYSWSMGDDGPALGYHVAGRWDALMAVETCHIVSPRNNELRRAFEAWAREAGLEAYHQRSGAGYLRHLVVREGRRTGDLLAVLVTAPGDPPALERLAELLGPDVTGVVHAVNEGVAEVTARAALTHAAGPGQLPRADPRPGAGALAGRLPADQHRDVRRALRPRAGAGRAAARRRGLGPVLRGGRDRAAGRALGAARGRRRDRGRVGGQRPRQRRAQRHRQRRVPGGRRRPRAGPAAGAGRAAQPRRSSTRPGPGSRPRPCAA